MTRLNGVARVGQRVSYEDMANPRREGVVTEALRDGEYAISWDDGTETISDCRQHGWTAVPHYRLEAEYRGTRPGYAVIAPDYSSLTWFVVDELREARELVEFLNEWRERVEDEIAKALSLGKTPKAAPTDEAGWWTLYRDHPSSLYATWYVLTGRVAAGSRS